MEPTKEQVDAHIEEILSEINEELPKKYRKGQEEHGLRCTEKDFQ